MAHGLIWLVEEALRHRKSCTGLLALLGGSNCRYNPSVSMIRDLCGVYLAFKPNFK